MATGLWEISFMFIKVHDFGTTFCLKFSLRIKTLLSSIKLLKRRWEGNLMFLFNNKKNLWKKHLISIIFFLLNEILQINM